MRRISKIIERGRCRILARLAASPALLSLAGCGVVIEVGRIPDFTALDSTLQRQVSTEADVRCALGEPERYGEAMLPVHDSPRTVWAYYYEASTYRSDQRFFLFVFLLDGRFDGYTWFSSVPGVTGLAP